MGKEERASRAEIGNFGDLGFLGLLGFLGFPDSILWIAWVVRWQDLWPGFDLPNGYPIFWFRLLFDGRKSSIGGNLRLEEIKLLFPLWVFWGLKWCFLLFGLRISSFSLLQDLRCKVMIVFILGWIVFSPFDSLIRIHIISRMIVLCSWAHLWIGCAAY